MALDPCPPAARGTLDEGQASVVEHRGGPLVVLGGPGTGKTTAIAAALAARAPTEPAGSVVGIAGDRRAAARLREAVAARIGDGLVPPVTTIHALALSCIRGWRAPGAPEDAGDLRLLSGAEEDVRIAELLAGAVADGLVEWPGELAAALPTLGLANEVRAFIARMRGGGLSPADVRRQGQGRTAWPALARFAELEAGVMALENVVDYPGLLDLAATIVARGGAAGPAAGLRAVYVDSAHDLDPLQERLLDALAAGGADLVLAGDPDQSVFGFRGAQRSILLDRAARGPTLVVRRCHRAGPDALATARRILGRQAPGALPAEQWGLLRDPLDGPVPATGGGIEVLGFDAEGDLGAHVAAMIRERVLLGGARSPGTWSSVAVIVRSAAQVDRVRRDLVAAGVPVVVPAADIPLPDEPAVRVLLDALATAVDPGGLTETGAADLLHGPLAAIDAADLRSAVRRWRTGDADRPGASRRPAALLRAALLAAIEGADPDASTAAVDSADGVDRRIGDLGRLIAAARHRVLAGDPPAEVLWVLWSGALATPVPPVPWPERLRSAALRGSVEAHHDLDAVTALFATAERFTQRHRGVAGVRAFLAGLREQRVPAEPVADRSPVRDAVEILTVHRAVGREWDDVYVVGAQEGSWPARSGAGSLLGRELLDGPPATRAAAALAEERRCLYLALTRARRRTVVAVVAAPGEAGEQPSRFLDDLGIPLRHLPGRPARDRTLDGLVGHLRTVAEDPDESAGARTDALAILAILAGAADDSGRPLVPAAHPGSWWGLATAADDDGAAPVEAPAAIELSPSQVDTLLECPLRWFLQRRAQAPSGSAAAPAIGSLVHALAEGVARGERPADPHVLDAALDDVWDLLPFTADWESAAARDWVRDALARLCAYHRAAERELVAVEAPVAVDIDVEGRPVRLRGVIDRVEREPEGALVAVDLKTSTHRPTGPEVSRHRQLALYQAAIAEGGLDDAGIAGLEGDSIPGGAALVQLRMPERGTPAQAPPGMPLVQVQDPLPAAGAGDIAWLADDIGRAIRTLEAGRFPATPGYHCRRCPLRPLCPAHLEPTGAATTAEAAP